jgi:hypothetical protein
MKLEQQVCSLELAKRLKELGIKQQSALYWVICKDKESELSQLEYTGQKSWLDGMFERASAFTVAELGEMLPAAQLRMIHRSPVGDCWTLPIHAEAHASSRGTDHVETEADARAKMLIYLFENKLIQASK